MQTSIPIVLRVSPEHFVEISNIEKFDDGSGYRSTLKVASGAFLCSDHSFYFDNLKKFTSSLVRAYEKVEGKARLAHTYEKDFLEVEVQKKGHVLVAGFIIQFGPPQQQLHFSFECDQTYLPELLRSLTQVGEVLK